MVSETIGARCLDMGASSSGPRDRSTPHRPPADAAEAARVESPSEEDAACPHWPHISDKMMKQYRRKLTPQKLQEYIFLYSCYEQCVDCCARCVQEFDIDPKHCESTGCDGMGWAKKNGLVSQEFRDFWEGLMSETV